MLQACTTAAPCLLHAPLPHTTVACPLLPLPLPPCLATAAPHTLPMSYCLNTAACPRCLPRTSLDSPLPLKPLSPQTLFLTTAACPPCFPHAFLDLPPCPMLPPCLPSLPPSPHPPFPYNPFPHHSCMPIPGCHCQRGLLQGGAECVHIAAGGSDDRDKICHGQVQGAGRRSGFGRGRV